MITTSNVSLAAPFSPRVYQRIAAKFLLEHPRGMLVADPGLGKTSSVLSALDLLLLGGSSFFPALVLAPKRVADVVWTGERNKWATFHYLKMLQITGTASERMEILRKPTADIYVINYELVEWLVEVFPFEKWPFKIVIADESSKLKGHRMNKGGKRAQALSNIARYTGRWWNLTGTPMPNGRRDLWGQYWFLDFGERLKRTFGAYEEAYFMQNVYTRQWSEQNGSAEIIDSAVADLTCVIRAVDWLPLDKEQEIPIEIQMPPKVMALYKEMEKELFVQLPGADIEAGTAAIRSQKLLQMCSGSIYDENSITHSLHDAKLEGLEDVLDQIAPQPLLVAYYWQFDVPRILAWCEKRGIPARQYKGQKDEDDWNAGKIRVLLLHWDAAYGLNLHEPCHDVCFYSHYWRADLWTQMKDRIGAVRQYQLGKKRIARLWSLLMAGTIEHDVAKSNQGKISVEDAFKERRRIVYGQ